MTKYSTAKQLPEKSKSSARRTALAVMQALLVIALVVVLIMIVSDAARLSGSTSKSIDAADHLIRLQVVNGSGDETAAEEFAGTWENYTDDQLEIRIVEQEAFSYRPISKTYIVSRQADETAAELLALHLGLETENIEYNTLENNFRQISATLVLGADCRNITSLFERNRETQSKL